MKKCTKCKEEKSFDYFFKDKRAKDGYQSRCKICVQKYYVENKEKISEYKKKHAQGNKEKNIEYKKQYYLKNKKKIKERVKKYAQDNKEKIKERQKTYYDYNKEKLLESRKQYIKQYIKQNKEKLSKKTVKYIRERKKTDPIYKFKCSIRYNIKGAFKRDTKKFRKNTKTETILGCTIEEFRLYIQSQFKKGMSFENHGEWHLDHIIPMSLAINQEQAIKLNHYTNFQPLWAEENLSKSNKIKEQQLILI